MNDLKIFTNPEFGQVRTLMIGTEPYFVGKDVAEALEYTNPQKAIRDHVDEEDRTVNESFTVNGTAVVLINESGLYSLIFSSKKEEARRFKRWVTKEVLPAIMRTGFYCMRTQRSLTVHKVYYPVLERELEARYVRNVDIARELNIHVDTLRNRLSGRTRFSLDEAIKVQKKWFPDIPIDELFKHEKEEAI